MQRIVIFIFELCIITLSIYSADFLQRHINIIPDWLIHLPEVTYSKDDFITVIKYTLFTYAVMIAVGQLLLKPLIFSNAKRTVDEIFLFATAFAISSMTIFITTTVSFDPQLMVGIALISTIILIILHLLTSLGKDFIVKLKIFSIALLKRLFSIPGLIALILALSPGILAKLFTSNRDIANTITQIRIYMTSEDELTWSFVNAFPELHFTQPIALQFSPNNKSDLYILQRNGQLFLTSLNDDSGKKTLILDITDKVGDVEIENGALGFDLHPDYGIKNHYIYLYYTSVHGKEQINHLARYDTSLPTAEDRMLSETTLITWQRDNSGFHNGGSVEFGPDNFLYVAIGEMTDAKNHQRLDRLLVGGILRIDVDRKGGEISKPIQLKPETGLTGNYYIPTDNPLVASGFLEEFWSWGLRNPFRISFDQKTGQLWAGDVGSTVWEEVNRIERGGNYQFPYIEGREPTGKARPEPIVGFEREPIITYKHTAYDRAVIGGFVYRGGKYKELNGMYIFGDNYSGKVFIIPSQTERVEMAKTIARAPQYAQRGMTSFTPTPDGEILLTTLGKQTEATGLILKLIPVNSDTKAEFPLVRETETAALSEKDAYNIYHTNCARCHGLLGKGDGNDAPHLNVPIPDFSTAEFQSSRDDARLEKVIIDGGIAAGLSPLMPPWGLVLNQEEIAAMVAIIREFHNR